MSRLKLSLVAFCCIILFFVSSCTEHSDCLQDIEQSINSDKMNTCSMTFDVSLQDFDSSVSTRSTSGWSDGDKVYLALGNNVYGIAEFTSGSWSLNYYGTLKAGDTDSCVVYFFDNAETESSSFVRLNYDTAPFKAEDGKYAYDGKTLAVSANLKPMVGRIRFVGTPDSTLSVIGISRYTSYSITKNSITSSSAPVTLKVQSDGYTPYIYGFFTSSDDPRLNILTGESGFNRKLSSSIFQKGESGWMNIPTLKSHKGWVNDLYFKVDSIGFTMIPVKYNSSIFYLTETELTQALYAVVNKSSSPTYPNRPREFYSYSNCTSFISTLNGLTSIDFRLPTIDEWQFAAKGGELSQGYTYSGSDLIAEVAWYNSNSGGKVHDVAQLMPNELGFYDMSGNLSEWTYTDSYVNFCGGDYNSSSTYCKVTYYSSSSSSYDCGIRLALSIN